MRERGSLLLNVVMFPILLLVSGMSAAFQISNQTPMEHEPIVFDAAEESASVSGNITGYQWDFGDSSSGASEQISHVYVESGSYNVTLTVTTEEAGQQYGQADWDAFWAERPADPWAVFDEKKQKENGRWSASETGVQSYTFEKTVTVSAKPVSTQLSPVSVYLQDSQGKAISGATVVIGDIVGISNFSGLAELTIPETSFAVVRASKAGFITQALRVELQSGVLKDFTLTLNKEAASIDVANIEQSSAIAIDGAQINLPDSAFVNAAGEPATGTVSVSITPWSPLSEEDMAAFPGGNQALTSGGEFVELISFGMLSIEFSQDGNHLQLAEGKTAQLSMDLPFNTSFDGTPISEGLEIPLWNFDENSGLWIEEGMGYVVASTTSSSGFALVGEVVHFSTWNWDMKVDGGFANLSTYVQCFINVNGIPQALPTGETCNVNATATYANGQKVSKFKVVPAEGAEIIRIAPDITISFTGSNLTENLKGTTEVIVTETIASQVDIILQDELYAPYIDGLPTVPNGSKYKTLLMTGDINNPDDPLFYIDAANVVIVKDGVALPLFFVEAASDGALVVFRDWQVLYVSALSYLGSEELSLRFDVSLGAKDGGEGIGFAAGNYEITIPFLPDSQNNTANTMTFNIVIAPESATGPMLSYLALDEIVRNGLAGALEIIMVFWSELGVSAEYANDLSYFVSFLQPDGSESAFIPAPVPLELQDFYNAEAASTSAPVPPMAGYTALAPSYWFCSLKANPQPVETIRIVAQKAGTINYRTDLIPIHCSN